jgi:uncharacterized membrane protein
MALDHVRDWVTNQRFRPEDLSKATPALFATRWITHFCAPVFVFLAGTGARLSLSRGRSPRTLSRFLWTRGLWLVIVEVTLVSFGWSFDPRLHVVVLQVIWAIGWSMVVLALLVRFPVAAAAAFGIAMIAGHDLLDPIRPGRFGAFAWVWNVLHVQSWTPIARADGHAFMLVYPLIPWVGVMAAGYAFGEVYSWDAGRRRFLDCEKYPPSLLYLLMTLGPSIALLAMIERPAGPIGSKVVVYGRVPFFYYVVHIPLLHAMAVAAFLAVYGPAVLKFGPENPPPAGFGLGLPGVYAAWAIGVAVLYLPCRWFAGVKARRRDPWLSYL